MFSSAFLKVSQFTMPVIISQKHYNGSVTCGSAAFIILNEEGWILTAAHILKTLRKHTQDVKLVEQYEKDRLSIDNNAKIKSKDRRKLLRKLNYDDKWTIRQSYWWGADGQIINNFWHNDFLDIAIGKLEPYKKEFFNIRQYPVFKNPRNSMPIGASLCKLGFPFHKISATYNENNDAFLLEKEVLPMPLFPIDGIHTRVSIFFHQETGKSAKFIETSTPGLRGQSGGPIFDVNGNIWAMQCKTVHLPLGFSPKLQKEDNTVIEEHQFLNVGLGTHVEEILKFLDQHNVEYIVENKEY